MPNYGDATYWDERYKNAKNETFDWLESWDDLKHLIEKYAVQGLNVESSDDQAKEKD